MDATRLNARIREVRVALKGRGFEKHTSDAVLAMMRDESLSYRRAAAMFRAQESNVFRAARFVPEVRAARAMHRKTRAAA